MNINVLIDKIKKDVGLNGILGASYNDTIIRDSIINNSLKTFNRVSGFHIVLNVDSIVTFWSKQVMGGIYSYNDVAYRIPDLIMDRFRELGVEIKRAFLQDTRRYGLMNGWSISIKNDLPSWTAKSITKQNIEKPQISFRPPASLVMKNMGQYNTPMYGGYYKVVIECTHPKNLSTITIGLEQWFEQLCKYDIMVNLYNNDLKNLKIELGSGSVDLQLDNFANAEGDRTNLLEQIRQKAAIDQIILTYA